jgi:hypothetical protein
MRRWLMPYLLVAVLTIGAGLGAGFGSLRAETPLVTAHFQCSSMSSGFSCLVLYSPRPSGAVKSCIAREFQPVMRHIEKGPSDFKRRVQEILERCGQ